jgi:hypothetical protein
MAYWTQQGGWQTYSLPTNAKTDYWGGDFAAYYPHTTSDDFADSYPYKDASAYVTEFPANRQTSKTFWYKLNKNGKVSEFFWDAKVGLTGKQKQLTAMERLTNKLVILLTN